MPERNKKKTVSLSVSLSEKMYHSRAKQFFGGSKGRDFLLRKRM